MARTHVTRENTGPGLSSYGEMLDPVSVQSVMDKLDEHDVALDAVVPSGGSVPTSGSETVTSGALNTTGIAESLLSVTGTVAFTLADGTAVAQRKRIECTVAATSPAGTLTITTPAGSEPATHVFTAVGQQLELEWNGTGWHCINKRRAGRQAVVVGTTVLTGHDMCKAYDLSVTGTVHSTTTKGIPGGCFPGERIHLDVTTATGSPVGDIAIAGFTTAGAAATSFAHLEGTDAVLDMEWDGTGWQATTFTAGGTSAATYS